MRNADKIETVLSNGSKQVFENVNYVISHETEYEIYMKDKSTILIPKINVITFLIVEG